MTWFLHLYIISNSFGDPVEDSANKVHMYTLYIIGSVTIHTQKHSDANTNTIIISNALPEFVQLWRQPLANKKLFTIPTYPLYGNTVQY